MISDVTLTNFSYPITFGSFLRCIPFKWNRKNRLLDISDTWTTKIVMMLNITLNIFDIAWKLVLLGRNDFTVLDKIFMATIMAILLAGLTGQFHLLLFYKRQQRYFNKLILFNSNSSKCLSWSAVSHSTNIPFHHR